MRRWRCRRSTARRASRVSSQEIGKTAAGADWLAPGRFFRFGGEVRRLVCGEIAAPASTSHGHVVSPVIPRDWRMEDLRVIAKSLGIDNDQHGTSHVVFRHARAGRLTVPAHRPIKPIYVRQFVELIDRMGEKYEDRCEVDP